MGSFRPASLPCIFTGKSSSPGCGQRQRGSRYAIHAGQQLTAKEFRYLRTVRVTAAVYQGLAALVKGWVRLLAPGRRQILCNLLKIRRILCF